ncbi:DNA circularization protein [Kluyvera ascorbata]|uniref:DNA circularization protein n=1 Tax=Kluyvera ascorbata TaxID=51288 RepID=UPI0035CCD2CE
MAIVADAISSLLGLDSGSEPWYRTLRQASFRGVPFAVKAEETAHGRRVAIHEYPYRDTAWVEDMGRGIRKITLRCFIIQDSLIYGGGSVIEQRQRLTEACEKKGAGTLIHPTLGELTVSIPDNGLRIGGEQSSGRVFEFSLICIESGLKVFAVTTSVAASASVKTNYLRLVSTAVLTTIARVKGEIRSVTQGIKTIKNTVAFWTNMVESTVSEVTNIGNTLKSTFGNTRYGRYNHGQTGGSSGVNGQRDIDDASSTALLVQQTMAQSVTDRATINSDITTLNNSSTSDAFIQGVSDVVLSVLNSTGGISERIRALEILANSLSTQYQQATADQNVADSINALILVLCSGAMATAAVSANPGSRDEADALTERVCAQLETALVKAADRGDDEIYQALLEVRAAFITTMETTSEGLVSLVEFSTPSSLPALTLANRLYQDVGRAGELIAGTSVPHPAFMPTKMKVLRK